MCDWVCFSVGCVWRARIYVPCCAWRARGGVSALILAQSAVLWSCMLQSQCPTAVVYEPTATVTQCCLCCVCGVAVLDTAACGCGRVCNAAPPLCATTVLMNMFRV